MTANRRAYGGQSADERRAGRRARLLEACLDIVGEQGVGGVSIEAVSARAGLGKRYFYESFATREEILVELVTTLFVELRAALTVPAADSQPDLRARAVVEALVGMLAQDPRRARLYAESPGYPALAEVRHRAVGQFSDLLIAEVLPPAPSEGSPARLLAVWALVAGTTDLITSWLRGEIEAESVEIIEGIVALGAALTRE